MLSLQVHNEKGKNRVVVTKSLPGDRWLDVLKKADCRVEVCTEQQTILDNETIKKLIGDDCIGVLGQLTEVRSRQRPCMHVLMDAMMDLRINACMLDV